MGFQVRNGGNWDPIDGTQMIKARVSGAWSQASKVHRYNSGTSQWEQVYQYDNTGPTVPKPTSTPSGNDYVASWGAITDSGSGVASATVYQLFYGSSTGWVAGSSYSLTSGQFSGGSYTFSVPTSRRHQQGGETWWTYHYIVAVDNAGNSSGVGPYSDAALTRPYGNFTFAPIGAGSWNGSSWGNTSTANEGMVGVSTTWASGAWFYGSAIYDACKGFAADSGSIFLQRAGAAQPNRGNSGTFYLKACDRQGASGAPTFVGTQVSQAISGNDGVGLPAIYSDWLTAFANGSAYGAGLVGHSAIPGFLRGLTVSTNNNLYSIYSGTIFLTFN